MSALTDYRKIRDEFFASDPKSPLTEEQKATFKGLHYYPENPDLRLTLKIIEFLEERIIFIQTSKGEVRSYERYGKITFPVEGVEVSLTIYLNDFNLFLPFADNMAGNETYPAGRYLEIEGTADDSYLIDFNMAYNPYCAYNDRWSCPVTPAENHLPVVIKAGEMLYQVH